MRISKIRDINGIKEIKTYSLNTGNLKRGFIIGPLKNWPIMNNCDINILLSGEVLHYNEHIYLALDRKVLRKVGEELKKKLIEEKEKELEMYKNIKIVTKYK